MPTSKLEPAPPYKESSTVVSTRVARNANENTATMVTEKGDVFLAKYDYPTIKNKTKKELMLSIPERIATSSEYVDRNLAISCTLYILFPFIHNARFVVWRHLQCNSQQPYGFFTFYFLLDI